jgi:hypothetical protein
MTKNKKKSPAHQNTKAPAVPKKTFPRNAVVLAVVAVAVIAGAYAMSNRNSEGQAPTASSETKYTGRLLPADYVAPKVAEVTVYAETIPMTVIDATQDGGGFTVPLDAVVANKIVRFDYEQKSGEALPMIAYVKTSGKLFVGVSYCPPCQGEGQQIAADGTLTCESCGTRRVLETNEGLSGACKLYPLDEIPATVDADKIVIDGSVLDSWTPQPLDRPVG